MAKKIFVDTEQVNDINKQISILSTDVGTVPLTTTAKNLKGAVNELDNEMNVLTTDRGYLTSKVINSGTLDNLPNGKYIVQLNEPGWGYLEVNWLSNDEWEQKFTPMDKNNPILKIRVKQSGTVGKWISYATTDKVDILFPYASGFATESAYWNSVLTKYSDGAVTFEFNFKRIDGTAMSGNFDIGTIPVGYRPKSHKAIIANVNNNNYCLIQILSSGQVKVFNAPTGSTYIECFGIYNT